MATIELLLDTAAVSASSEYPSICQSNVDLHSVQIYVMLANSGACTVYAQRQNAAAGNGNA